MKNSTITKSILALFAFSLVITSCTKENVTTQNTTEKVGETKGNNSLMIKTSNDVALSLKADTFIDDLNEFTPTLFSKKITGSDFAKSPFDCAKYDINIEDISKKIITLTFDEKGCEIEGHVFKGKIIYQLIYNKETKSFLKSKTYENLSMDDITVNGTIVSAVEFDIKSKTQQMKHTMDVTISFADGKTATRKGEMIVKMTGKNTPKKEDDTIEKTGQWVTTLEDGTEYYYKITTPILFVYNCMYPVSGVTEIKNTEVEGVLNYGDGECDNKATFTNADGDIIVIEF